MSQALSAYGAETGANPPEAGEREAPRSATTAAKLDRDPEPER